MSVNVTYFAVSAPLVIRVLINSSWPYLAAMCKGVFPFLSSQSISAPAIKTLLPKNTHRHTDTSVRKKQY